MPAAQLSSRARDDLLSAPRWIAKDDKLAARGLREAVIRAASRIGEFPKIGVQRLDLAGERIRFVYLTGYPYILVYNAERVPPLILRVLHGARDLPELLRGF